MSGSRLNKPFLGGMSLEHYLLMREVIAAIREGIPSADQLQPGCWGRCETVRTMIKKPISLADFTTEWRNHSHSNLHFLGVP